MEELQKIEPGMPVVKESQGITAEKLKRFMPKGCSARVTDEVLETIRNIENDTGLSQEYTEERIMSSMHMLGKKGASVETLVNAIKYACLKQHYSNKQAWEITFPEKYKKLTDEGRFVDSHVSEYNRSDMVVEVEKSMLIPAHVTYQSYYHKAIEKQFNLMNGIGASDEDRVSAHVQHLAAKELAELTKMPEDNSIELKISASDQMIEQQKAFNENLQTIIANQQAGFKAGIDVGKLQKIHLKVKDETDIVDAEVE